MDHKERTSQNPEEIVGFDSVEGTGHVTEEMPAVGDISEIPGEVWVDKLRDGDVNRTVGDGRLPMSVSPECSRTHPGLGMWEMKN